MLSEKEKERYDNLYVEIVVNMKIPEGFDEWHITRGDGWTLAHAAAFEGYLPENFTQWGIKGPNKIPLWEIVSRRHILYKYPLPPNFSDWDMVITENGETCRDIYDEIERSEKY